MIDINFLRENTSQAVEKLSLRGFHFNSKLFLELEEERKKIQIKTQELQEVRNQLSKKIGVEKSLLKNTDDLMREVSKTSADLKMIEIQLHEVQQKINDYLMEIPNLPHPTVPIGKNEADNIVIREVGSKKKFDFEVKDHVDVASKLGLDFDLGSKLSGSRFTLMRNQIARLHRAIGQFMLDVQVNEHGYEECYTPYLVNTDSLVGTGQLPKFEEDLFLTKKGENDLLYLIPTGEVPLTNIVRNSI
ncbi:MAG: serine--tRNA ligase, partial [Methylophilaceae bacterium]|nr:serine--tRNA ligase [Methylophilaceae bacterium]